MIPVKFNKKRLRRAGPDKFQKRVRRIASNALHRALEMRGATADTVGDEEEEYETDADNTSASASESDVE